MEKIKVVLVVLNKKNLNDALSILNYGKVTPFLVLTEDGDGKFIAIDKNTKVQVAPFALIDQAVEYGKNFLWLICGQSDIPDAPAKMKNFLTANGVPEKNIVNFNLLTSLNRFWFANLRAAEKSQLQAFATDKTCAKVLKLLNTSSIPSSAVRLNLYLSDLRLILCTRTASKIFRHAQMTCYTGFPCAKMFPSLPTAKKFLQQFSAIT